MSKRVMHLERPNGGLMCANKPVPSRWQRTTDPEQVTCSRCQVVYRMHQRKAWTVPSADQRIPQE